VVDNQENAMSNEKLEEQIIAMLTYLKQNSIGLYHVCAYTLDGGLFAGMFSDERAWNLLHTDCVKQCREKAIRQYVDIEMANNNLFWCCYE